MRSEYRKRKDIANFFRMHLDALDTSDNAWGAGAYILILLLLFVLGVLIGVLVLCCCFHDKPRYDFDDETVALDPSQVHLQYLVDHDLGLLPPNHPV